MKPNKTNIRKWIKALNSGNYEQGKEHLYKASSDRYCCLGVACKLYAKEKKINFKKLIKNNSYLPEKVKNWLGVNDNDPIMYLDNGIQSLARLNDVEHYNFKYIADCIETKYLK